jgi:hypothetical protein
MKTLTNPAWLATIFLFLMHQAVQYGFNYSVPLAGDYLDPFLAIPILLGALLIERRWLFGRPWLTMSEVIIITLTLAYVFEFFFPHWQPRFISDPYDFVAYGFGALYFWWLINPKAGEKIL